MGRWPVPHVLAEALPDHAEAARADTRYENAKPPGRKKQDGRIGGYTKNVSYRVYSKLGFNMLDPPLGKGERNQKQWR